MPNRRRLLIPIAGAILAVAALILSVKSADYSSAAFFVVGLAAIAFAVWVDAHYRS